MQSLGFVVKHLRCVPHTFTPTQKAKRAALSIEVLRQLRSIEHHGCQFIVTFDESWFYLSPDYEQISLRVEDHAPEKPKDTIQDPKMVATIAWNPLGFHLLEALPKGSTFNTDYDCVNILTELLPLRRRLMGGDSLFMVTTQDLTPPENAELYAKTIGSASPYTHRTHQFSHHPTSLSSDISNITCRESPFHHVKNCLQQFMKSLGPSRGQPWKTCFGTGWRDANRFLRIMVTTMHKRNTGWFTFLGFVSESEMLLGRQTLYLPRECIPLSTHYAWLALRF
jgi:hypothetical protein